MSDVLASGFPGKDDSRRLWGSIVLGIEHVYGTGRVHLGTVSMEIGGGRLENNVEDSGSYDELLANIRRLAIMLLDSLEEGLKNGTLDSAQKRLLSSTGARLLRLWKNTVKERMALGHGKTSDGKGPGPTRASCPVGE